MVTFYLMRIAAGKLTLEDIPAKWHDEVGEKLKEE